MGTLGEGGRKNKGGRFVDSKDQRLSSSSGIEANECDGNGRPSK